MALDYSKLSDEELQAIANDDYTKLSDKTLRQITRDPSAKQTTFEKFTAPLKEMSVEDWKKESIAYPVLQTMYGLLPFQGKQGEQAYVEGMQGIKQKGDAIVQGIKNVAQDPAAAAQAAWQAVTERPAETMGNLVKGAVYDPELLFVPVPGAKQATQAVSQAAGAVARPVIQGAKTGAAAVADVGRGALGRATGTIAKPGVQPEVWQTRSSRQPAGETYHPPADIQAWQKGEIPTAEVGSEMWTPEQQAALARTRGNVPFQGEVPRAIGEQLVEPYTTWQGWMPDVALGLGGTLLGVGPVAGPALNMARRGYNAVQGIRQAGAMQKLGDVGLTPLYKEELAALKSGQPHPSAIGDVAGPVTPVAEPVATAPTVTTQPVVPQPVPRLGYSPTPSVMYGSETGIVGKTPQEVVTADLAQRYAPQPVAPVAPETVTAPAVTAPPTKALTVGETTGKTAEQLAAEQQILDFINARRGIVANDPAANRQNFANKVSETRQQLEIAREQNKQMFGDRAKAMNERAGEGSMTPSQKDTITDATAVRYMINQTTQSAVKQQGKKVSYSENAYNDLAQQAGITLDWKTAPDISNMSVGEARKAMNKWMFDSIDAQSPELGLKTRRESLRTQERRAERESAGQPEATMTPEETEALRKRQEKLLGSKSSSAGQSSGISPALQALLDKQKAAGNYRGPKDAMEMMTGDMPTNNNAIAGLIDDPQYKITDTLHKHGNFANPLTVEQAVERKTLHQFGMGGDLDYTILYKTDDGKTVVMNEYQKTPTSTQPELIAKTITDRNTANQAIVRYSKDGSDYIVSYSEAGKTPSIVITKEKPSNWLGEFNNTLPEGFKMPANKDQFHDIFGYGDTPSNALPKLKDYSYNGEIGRHIHGENKPLNEMDARMRGQIQSASRPGQDYEINYKKGKNIITEKTFMDDGETYVSIQHPDGTTTVYIEFENPNIGSGKANVKSGKMYGYQEFDKNGNILTNIMNHSKPAGMPNILGK